MVYQKDLEAEREWHRLLGQLELLVGKRPTGLNAVLFLIGVQELGVGAKQFDKEEKQDLMHIAICKLLSYAGYYKLEGIDSEGWPQWNLIRPLPHFDLGEQEKLLKLQSIEYFKRELKLDL